MYDENGVNITGFRPEYWHTDHLGNVRLAFSDVNNNGRIEIEDDPATQEDDTEIMQENHYYPFGMNQMGPWYETVAPPNKYQYNGKELNEELGLDWYDYGARWYDGAVGRFTGVDPLAEERAWMTPYNYVQNNPILRIDPNGALDSPIFDKDGNFLGVDSEGYTGEIIIMDRTAYNTVSNGGKKILNHDQVMIWVNKSPLASSLNDAGLTPEAFSKIYTHIVMQMEGEMIDGKKISFDRLEGGIIHIIDTENAEDGLSQVNGGIFGNPLNISIAAEAGAIINKDGTINVTTRLLFGTGQMETVEHAQSTLGIHEYYGHGVKGLDGGSSEDHVKVYRLQYNHKRTFNKLNPRSKTHVKKRARIKD
jgi:RHS repeat-associated protein